MLVSTSWCTPFSKALPTLINLFFLLVFIYHSITVPQRSLTCVNCKWNQPLCLRVFSVFHKAYSSCSESLALNQV